MKIYIASKTKHAARWRALRAAGYPINSSWIDESEPGQTADWPDLWRRCIEEAAAADALVLYAEPGEQMKGALVEAGAALAAGKRVFVIGCEDFSFLFHPLVRRCEGVVEAMQTIAFLDGLGKLRQESRA